MNLSTARSSSRAKAVGMRKVFGANKSQLVYQFLGDSILYAVISLVFTLFIVVVLNSRVNELFSKTLEINYLGTPIITAGIFGIVIFIGLFAGSYPAFFLSKFNSVQILRGHLNPAGKNSVSEIFWWFSNFQ